MAIIENPLAAAKPLDPMFTLGRHVRIVQAQINVVGGTTAANDVFVLAKGLPAAARIVRIMTPKGTPAVTGLTDVDFGFYQSQTNKVVDADAVADGVTFASALGNLDLVGKNVTSFATTADIATLCGHGAEDIPAYGYDLCATINAIGSTGGVIDLDIYVEED